MFTLIPVKFFRIWSESTTVYHLEQAPQGSGSSTRPTEVQKLFEQCCQTQGLNFVWSCVVLDLSLCARH